ncbi:MAG TPA: hypothetical protein VNL98_06700 [Gemmatimonadales bacterium]|nr:hypothetical protein [Gemmatimonadales bacterium]
MARSHLDIIHEALDAGLTLTLQEPSGSRTFVAGQITRDRRPNGSVRTTHLSRNLTGYVWLTPGGLRILAAQARELLARKEEILAERDARVASFLDR